MRIVAIIHAPFEEVGYIATWAQQMGHELQEIHHYDGVPLPELDDFDALISMGGPQSAVHFEQYPYLGMEVTLLAQAIATDKPVLGICLGAQLISAALGARPEASLQKEIGVFPISLTEAGQADPLFSHCPPYFPVAHWHNDMVGQIEGAEVLAYSAGCPRQAFRYGKRVYGLQCHMEFTNELMEQMLKHCADDLNASVGDFVQTPEQLLEHDYTTMNHYLHDMLNVWIEA